MTIHLFQFRLAGTEQSFLVPPHTLPNLSASWSCCQPRARSQVIPQQADCYGNALVGEFMVAFLLVFTVLRRAVNSDFVFFVDGMLLPNLIVEKLAKLHLPAFGAGFIRSPLVLVLVCTFGNVTPSVRTWVFTQKQAAYFVVVVEGPFWGPHHRQ